MRIIFMDRSRGFETLDVVLEGWKCLDSAAAP